MIIVEYICVVDTISLSILAMLKNLSRRGRLISHSNDDRHGKLRLLIFDSYNRRICFALPSQNTSDPRGESHPIR